MSGKTEAEAYQQFIALFQRALSCVSDAVLLSTGYRPRTQPHIITLSQDPTPLRGPHRLGFSAFCTYRLVNSSGRSVSSYPWSVKVTGYAYAFHDSEGREILAYHWHPEGISPLTIPHLHLGPAAHVGFAPLHRAHLPTRRIQFIQFDDILRLALTDLGVTARRTDWETTLAETGAALDPPEPNT